MAGRSPAPALDRLTLTPKRGSTPKGTVLAVGAIARAEAPALRRGLCRRISQHLFGLGCKPARTGAAGKDCDRRPPSAKDPLEQKEE
jgi:hypothetical protein